MSSTGLSGLPRKVKRAVKSLLGRDFFAKVDYRCPYQSFGSPYGGWTVAFEPIDARSVVYSFGVGEDASFDLALIERFGLKVYAFDPTPKSLAWVKKQAFPANFIMHACGIAHFDGNAWFTLPDNPDFVSSTILERPAKHAPVQVPVKRLSTIMKELGHQHIDILKMDIEGAEYGVIEDLERCGIRPGQILVEFHHRFPEVGIAKSIHSISLLKRMGYGLYHVSGSGEELSFFYTPHK